MKLHLYICIISIFSFSQEVKFSKNDSLFGSNHHYRKDWDVLHYHLKIKPDFATKYLKGINIIKAKHIGNQANIPIQIDLQQPMKITKICLFDEEIHHIKNEENFYFFEIPANKCTSEKLFELTIHFEGNPILAKNPPWDGGWIFTRDEFGNPWMSVACQSNGASIWYPLKDLQADEPQNGSTVELEVSSDLVGVANGKLIKKEQKSSQTMNYVWEVKNTINSYNIVPYIGKYTHFSDEFKSETGNLSLDYYVLDYNIKKAKKHFKIKEMLSCFEHWFGTYPFLEDGYKLVEAPYLGMEHQSNIAYGNHYLDGYLGSDLSGTGVGLLFDFIIVHETGHEWFGNSITSGDVADLWIHEGFTSYAETLYLECNHGKKQAEKYVIGTRADIQNDKNIIGYYQVHNEGSSDMYFKGANLIHTIRHLLNDDEKFRVILRKMNKKYFHQTVTSKSIEEFLEQETQLELKTIFNQYLRTTTIPVLEIKKEKGVYYYRYSNCLENFSMKLKIKGTNQWVFPTTQWKESEIQQDFSIDENFYILQNNK
jgi:aminopeptidase N